MKQIILTILFLVIPVLLIYFLVAPILFIGQLAENIWYCIEQYCKWVDKLICKF